MREKTIIGASLGNDVHVVGIYRFLTLAEEHGYRAVFLGPSVPVESIVAQAKTQHPERMIVGYRLSEDAATLLFRELKRGLERERLAGTFPLILSCPPALRQAAVNAGIFDFIFTGGEPFDDILASLTEKGKGIPFEAKYPPTLPERVTAKKPFPLLRHHFGVPTVEETVLGVERIADEKAVDIISLGPDQNAQEFFFEPENMRSDENGAGGVPLRTREDLERIYRASRRGNYPLLRCYSGTNHLREWAHLLAETIHIAWGVVPIFWYSTLDGRSSRPLVQAIQENQEAMRTYINLGIPLEVNEAHQWSLRDAPDSVAAAAFFLGAYQAKAFGARHYVAQYMFNTPPGISPRADLAKMLAKQELLGELTDPGFNVFTQIRAGLSHFTPNLDIAKGQLAASTALGLHLFPDIIHVVGFCEANHIACSLEVVESARIVQGVLSDLLIGLPRIDQDPFIQKHKKRIKEEARLILETIREIASPGIEDPWTSPETLARAVETGLLDAPHLSGNPEAQGTVITRLRDSILRVVDKDGQPLTERQRISALRQDKNE
ncbi:MAG TPA: hypothetical protein VLH40_05715 [Atribacteraceae bacterium]|nr:hypothetical protein [Atribacteraceae bacterium]